MVMGNIWRLIEAKIPGSLSYREYHLTADIAKGRVRPGMHYFA
jgi:hypothetical protein